MELRPLRKGSLVTAGTVLGRIGKTDKLAPHVNFAIRPAGKGAPKIDPKPILDGWKLLEATAIYRASGENPFTQSAGAGNVAQDLLMSKSGLERKVLADPRLVIAVTIREAQPLVIRQGFVPLAVESYELFRRIATDAISTLDLSTLPPTNRPPAAPAASPSSNPSTAYP